MTNLHITLDTDNVAFQKNGWRKEAAHVLIKFAAQLLYSGSGKSTGALQDTDGEACGDWDYVDDDPEDNAIA